MRLVWTTDPHLNHAPDHQRERWENEIASHGADGVVISGDISEGDDVVFQLGRLAESFAVPIYFVLGNHDFYQSSIGTTRQRVIHASRNNGLLNYLTDTASLPLDDQGVFLLGEDGWGDATEGDYEGSSIELNDFKLIEDFQRTDPSQWKEQLQHLGTKSAGRLTAKLAALPDAARQVLVITHVPPFCDACWYEGQTTDDNWAPFFVCGSVGGVLLAAAASRPKCQFTVLCGHTHNAGVAHIAANMIVHTGAARYGYPEIEALVTIEGGTIGITKLGDQNSP